MLLESELRNLVKSCQICDLSGKCSGPVSPRGNYDAEFFVLCDTPYQTEDFRGEVLTGGPGKEFENYLRNIGLSIQRCYCTNVVKCFSKQYKDADIETCKKIWAEQELYSWHGGHTILALGTAAINFFLPGADIFKIHGIPQKVKYRFSNGEEREYVVFPMFHPSFGIQSSNKMIFLQEDFKTFKQYVAGNLRISDFEDKETVVDYREVSFDECAELLFGSDSEYIFVDTETRADFKTAWSIQFTFEAGKGYLFKVEDADTLQLFKAFVETPGKITVFHNAKFDLKVLLRLGIKPWKFEDSMIYAYNLQNQPQGLKSLSYRLAGMHMHSFNELVKPESTKKFMLYFLEILGRDWPESDPVLEWVDAPETTWTQIEERIPCTKRHKEKIVCDCHKESTLGIPMQGCRNCAGKGFYRIKRKRGEKVELPSPDGGHWKVKQPQNIKKKVSRIVNEFDKNPDLDVIGRWYNFEPSERHTVEETLGKKLRVADLSEVDYAKAINYACKDADATCRIYWILKAEAMALGLDDVIDVDHKIIQMVMEMEDFGMPADPEKFTVLAEYYDEEMQKLQELVDFIADGKINMGSPKQVNQLLFGKLGIKPKKFTDYEGENPSTDSEALMFIENSHPIVPLIMQWRTFQKAKTSFAEKLPKMVESDGRIRGNIKTTRTITGRLAMDEPNLMNIPTRTKEGQKVRECFVAPDGYVFTTGDYGQIEMRVACHDARDPIMTEIFIKHYESKGAPEWDIHRQTASRIFGVPISEVDEDAHRTPAKSAGFGILNQITGQGLADFMVKVGCKGWDADRCDELIKEWFGVYKHIRAYFEQQKQQARRYGYVKDMFGKIYRMPEYKSVLNNVRNQGERNTCNYFVQGGAQGIMKRGMIALRGEVLHLREAGYDIQYIVQIHDDMVDIAPEDCIGWYLPFKKAVFENAVKLSIPLTSDCKFGKSWGKLEKFKTQ